MAFIDDVHIIVKAGNGGNGATATKQLFGTKKTAPDGGNGGNGGNVYFKADKNLSDLSEFRYKKKITGINGVPGSHKDLDGQNGEDITVLVPYGTLVTDEKTGEYVELISDLPFCVAQGGQGGMGNHDFKPELKKFAGRVAQGTEGIERHLHLVLRLIADVGLVGLPNAGKSSLLKAMTNAQPKVGDYPFTTLEPNLGAFGKLIIADIPGLIEGASGGKGLGVQFLKHIKKTKILLHCVDCTVKSPLETYHTVRNEFKSYDSELLTKKEVILVTKIDLADPSVVKKTIAALKKVNKDVLAVSIYDEKSLEHLKELLHSFLLQ